MVNRSADWLKQAEEEFLWANDALEASRWALACFISQQVAEKCLKAIAIKRGATQVKSHSAKEIASVLGIDGEVEEMATALDLFYITTRNPDAFYSGAPFEYFSKDQSVEAVEFASRFLELARREIPGEGNGN